MGICHFLFLFFGITSISSIYFTYLYINNSLNSDFYDSNIDSVIERCFFMTSIVVDGLVHDYFSTFRFCWKFILEIFDSMITNYILFLGYLIQHLLIFPTSLILGTTSCILVWIVRLILRDLLTIKVNR